MLSSLRSVSPSFREQGKHGCHSKWMRKGGKPSPMKNLLNLFHLANQNFPTPVCGQGEERDSEVGLGEDSRTDHTTEGKKMK